MHPIHKHMSSRMGGRKADERYDAKEAYNKDLSGKARLHYLENDIHDKGMSMKSPMDMGHKSPAEMKSPMEVGPGAKSAKKKEYSIGQKLVGTAKNVGDYISGAYNKSEVLAGIGVTNPHGSQAERKHDLGKSKKAFERAAKRKKEGSAFFMESEGQEKKDLMKYNPIDDRAGSPADMSKKKTSPVNMASPMYDKGHEGDQDGHVHPRTQGEVDVMNKHGQALNKFIGKVNKFGNMSESQMSRVNDKINSLQGQYNKTRDSIGNVHKQFDLKRDQEFENLFGEDGK